MDWVAVWLGKIAYTLLKREQNTEENNWKLQPQSNSNITFCELETCEKTIVFGTKCVLMLINLWTGKQNTTYQCKHYKYQLLNIGLTKMKTTRVIDTTFQNEMLQTQMLFAPCTTDSSQRFTLCTMSEFKSKPKFGWAFERDVHVRRSVSSFTPCVLEHANISRGTESFVCYRL
jgi:hypothetical protein